MKSKRRKFGKMLAAMVVLAVFAIAIPAIAVVTDLDHENHPPYTPSNPSPPDGSTGFSIETDLSWTGGDPDTGDNVTYDVYFGITLPLHLVSSKQKERIYDPGILNYTTTYYWKIVATGSHGASTEGPLWNFTSQKNLVGLALFEVHDSFDVETEGDSLANTTHDAFIEYGIMVENIPDSSETVLGGLRYNVRAEHIGEVYEKEWVEHSPALSLGEWLNWTFTPEFYLVEDDWLWTGYMSNVTETRYLPMSLNRSFNKTVFDGAGYQHAEFTVTFDNLSFDWAYAQIIADLYNQNKEIDASFLLDTLSTDIPYYHISKKTEHFIEYSIDMEKIEPGVTYNFSVDLRVEPTGAKCPFIYKPHFQVGSGWSTGEVGAPQGKNVTIPEDMLPKYVYHAEASTNIYNGWYVSAVHFLAGTLEEVYQPSNHPPNPPSNPSPANHATDIPINANLSWTGGDPDPEDIVTYDVYFGTGTTPPLVSDNQTSITYDPGTLNHNIKYYWEIVTKDNHGASTEGPLWDFTTVGIAPKIFDTGPGTYPSIFGTHEGTITPNNDITISKMFTYPCSGTGGHTEYVRFYNESGTIAEANWGGYVGDWHNILFESPFTLEGGKTYNYTIRTGSYPQIHHTDNLSTPAGFITCSEFIDANGKRYNDWIPAIRLEL